MEHKKEKQVPFIVYDLVKVIAGIPGLIWHRPKIYYENDAARARIKTGALVIANHLGFIDPVYLMYAIWYRRHHFICLKKVFEGKLGWLFRLFLCIPIDKENFSIDSFHAIVDHLKNEELVTMFPEGKVNDGSGEMAQFKSGAVLMAFQSGKPIIPIYILPKKHWYERIRVIIGAPIVISAKNGSFKSVATATALLEEKLISLKAIMEERVCRHKTEK